MSYSLVISDVPVIKSEESIQRELTRTFDGVENVSRWYFDESNDYPMSCVQVDFNSAENMNKVLEKGVVIDGICRRVSKAPQCQRCQLSGHKTRDCTMKRLTECDLFNVFQQQEQQLSEIIRRFEVKLNEVTVRH